MPGDGHFGFPIDTKIKRLVEDHPVIISIMLQFHRLSSFWQEDRHSFWNKGHNFGNIKLIITKFILDLCTVVKKIITYKFQMVFLRGNLVIKSVFFNKSRDITPKQNQDWVFAHWLLEGLVYGVYRHFQQYFRYIVVVSFIGGGNQNTHRKPLTFRKLLTNFIT